MTADRAYLGVSPEAIRHHYDLSNDFFALWLDRTMTYSCALWSLADTLERAQERKLDHLLEGTRSGCAARLLDVGCGWGSLLSRATDRHGVRHAVGLTLSDNQAEWAARNPRPGVEVRVENWADHQPEQPYDAIVSVGAVEHFARLGLSRDTRLESYRRFFDFCRSSLRGGARLAIQTNVKGNNRRLSRTTVRDMEFVIETVFPESEIPALADLVEASERRFEVLSVRNDADHHIRTCREWLRRLSTRRAEAEQIVGHQVVANYERFLDTSAECFGRRHLGLATIIFEAV